MELKGLYAAALVAWHRAKGNLFMWPIQSLAVKRQDTDCHSGFEEPVALLQLPLLVLFQAANAFEGEHLLSVVPMLVTGLSCWLTAVIMRSLWGGNQCTEMFLCLVVWDLGLFVSQEALVGWARAKGRTWNDWLYKKNPCCFLVSVLGG